MLIQFEIFSGDELNKPMASVQILLLLYTIYNMYITCVLLKYVYTNNAIYFCSIAQARARFVECTSGADCHLQLYGY